MGDEPAHVLEVRGLSVRGSRDAIVHDLSLDVAAGEILAIVGESGAGKTAVSLALFAYARRGTAIGAGSVVLNGDDLVRLPPSQLRQVLGRRLAFVPQNPGAALNPALTIGAQLSDAMVAHRYARDTLSDRIDQLLEGVALSPAQEFARRYPHQLSGGQQQRAVIAMALSCEPEVIVLDEPTTGLDVTTQSHVIDLLARLRDESGTAMVYVTHNLAVVAKIADRVAVMYAGTIVESGPTSEIFAAPRHPYTRTLIGAVPRLDGLMAEIAEVPPLAGRPVAQSGCVFLARCPYSQPRCADEQLLEHVGAKHDVRCVRWREIAPMIDVRRARTLRDPASTASPLLRIRDVDAGYVGGDRKLTTVVRGVSLELAKGECLAIVGESGSGKSTLARCIVGLHSDWTGAIEFVGSPLAAKASKRSIDMRRRIQIVFQNPDRSLNPLHTVAKIVMRPAVQLLGMDDRSARARAGELLDQVQLPRRYLTVYPTELSGGERQRVAIARALAADGDLIVCDEITSALDVSVQAALIDLLQSLRDLHDLSLLFISHDLAVVRAVADRIAVMERGVICEQAATEVLFDEPRAAYTRTLIAAAPQLPPLSTSTHPIDR